MNDKQIQPPVVRNEITESGNERWGHRIFKSIVVGSKNDVIETILLSVVPNAITSFISEGVSAVFGVLLYGKDWYGKNRGLFLNKGAISSSGTRFMTAGTDYHAANKNAMTNGGYVQGPLKNANGYLFSNVVFYDGEWVDNDGHTVYMTGMAKAKTVLAALLDTIDRYHEVSVEAFYAEAHAPVRDSDYMDACWVWKNLEGTGYTVHEDGGISLNLPDPVYSKK